MIDLILPIIQEIQWKMISLLLIFLEIERRQGDDSKVFNDFPLTVLKCFHKRGGEFGMENKQGDTGILDKRIVTCSQSLKKANRITMLILFAYRRACSKKIRNAICL